MPRTSRKTAADVNVEPPIQEAFALLLGNLGSPASRVGYEKDWVAWRLWLKDQKLDVVNVTPMDVKRYVNHLLSEGKAKKTRGRAISVLRASYGAFVEAGLLKANPARETKNPKQGGVKRTPWIENEEDLAKILGWQGSGTWRDRRDRLCVQLVAGLGWRRSEIARIRIEDIRGNSLRGILKGGKEGEATLADWLLEEIRDWCEFAEITSGPLFPRSQKNRSAISSDIVYNIVERVAMLVGFPKCAVNPHALRRTLATHADLRGVPLAEIQRHLGHSNITTTERYVKASRRSQHAPSEFMAALLKNRAPTESPAPSTPDHKTPST